MRKFNYGGRRPQNSCHLAGAERCIMEVKYEIKQ
jgi:hypothetical protein